MQRILSIDLGTTNSVAAYMSKGMATPVGFTANDQIFPSIVSIERNGKIEVGVKAKNSLRNKIYSAKRFIGRKYSDEEVQHALTKMDLPYKITEGADGDVRLEIEGREFSPIMIGALVLRKIKEAAEAQHGEFSRAIITVPAYFRESQVAATREAGRLAGFHVVQIINEPTAAALAYGALNAAEVQSKLMLVYDFGGGTFDVSVLMPADGSFTVLEIGGDAFLGGDNIDNLMMRRVRDATLKEQSIDIFAGAGAGAAKRQLKAEVEKAKIGLSQSFEEVIELNNLNGANVYYTFRREEIEQIIAPLVDRSIELTLQTLNNQGFSAADIDMVLLVGGTTQIPLIRRRLAELFSEEKLQTKNINPMLCVAEGAAVLSAVTATIDCLNCMTNNDIERDTCSVCSAPLYGSGNPIVDLIPDGPQKPLVIVDEVTGLKCMECGNVCRQGVTVCPKCNADLAVKETIDITAHPVGIELVDGSFAKIIDTGTHFPMQEWRMETFRTAMDNQPRLEVNVFEGIHSIAKENELLGSIDIPLLTSYPKGTPINVSLKLDRSRTTEVSVKIGTEAQSYRLKRADLLPEIKASVVKTRQDILTFLDRWKDETTPSEQIALKEHITTLGGFLSGDAASGRTKQEIEAQVQAGKDLLEICTNARGRSAALFNTIQGLDGIAPQNDLRALQTVYQELMQARTYSRWESTIDLVKRADDAIERIGRWRGLLLAENFLSQGLFSPSLATRVQNSVESIRRGVTSNNSSQTNTGFDALDGLWPEIDRELASNRNTAGPIVRPDR